MPPSGGRPVTRSAEKVTFLLVPLNIEHPPQTQSIFLKMTELPYEIWLLIVEYLPDYHIRRLYSVNKAFFSIALDLRYREVCLGILADRVVERTIRPVIG